MSPASPAQCMDVTALVLAAGTSERLGQPKPLVDCGKESLIKLQVRRLFTLVHSVFVVTSAELEQDVREACTGTGAMVVVNPDPEAGRTGTVQIGIDRILSSDGAVSILIVPVDRPGWTAITVARMLEHGPNCCPEKDGKGGHPLLIGPSEAVEILFAEAEIPLNRLVRTKRISVDDPHLHLNIDQPSDLEQIPQLLESLLPQERLSGQADSSE